MFWRAKRMLLHTETYAFVRNVREMGYLVGKDSRRGFLFPNVDVEKINGKSSRLNVLSANST